MDDPSCVDCSGHGRKLHILMFPWLAHGHIAAYSELSIRLLAHGCIRVSFLSTPLNIDKIRPLMAGKVQLMELELPCVEGLPVGIENTADLPIHLTPLFDKAVDGLEKPFEHLLRQIRPNCVVFDFCQWWAPKAAAKLGIPAVFFQTFGAAFSSYGIHPARRTQGEITAQDLTKPPPDYPSSTISWKIFEAEGVMGCYKAHDSTGISYLERGLRCYEGCSAMAIKTCIEIEGTFVQYLQKVIGKPVLPLGPLLPVSSSQRRESICLTWLEEQTPSSVVYVAFGSQVFLSKEDIREIALGLEDSLQPFLWALRAPHGGDQGLVTNLLPPGFEERIRGRGLVVEEWVPQTEILSHLSTGGFMTHCGWASLMEGMSCGLPFIALPVQLDQCLNARLICQELQVGVEVGRVDDGSLKREEICRAVRRVMVEEQRRHVRAQAGEMGKIFKPEILDRIRSQELYINQFISYLQLLTGI